MTKIQKIELQIPDKLPANKSLQSLMEPAGSGIITSGNKAGRQLCRSMT